MAYSELLFVVCNVCDLSRFVDMAPPENTKEKDVTAVVRGDKLIKNRKSFWVQEKLEIIARVEGGEKLHAVWILLVHSA